MIIHRNHFQKSTSGIDSCDGTGVYDDDRTTCHHAEDTMTDCVDGNTTTGRGDHVESSRTKSVGISVVQRANHNLQNLQNLRNCMTPARIPGTASQYASVQSDVYRGQILGVRNLRPGPVGQVLSPTRSIGIPATPSIAPCAPSYAKVGCELGPSSEKPRDNNDRVNIVDKSNVEYSLNAQESVPASVGPKKSVKGVKLVGMEGGTLRRPSLQVRDDSHVSSPL